MRWSNFDGRKYLKPLIPTAKPGGRKRQTETSRVVWPESNFDQSIDIVRRFNSKSVFVYAMGQEPWLVHIISLKYTEQSRPIIESNRLIQECMKHGIHAERLFGEKEILIEEVN